MLKKTLATPAPTSTRKSKREERVLQSKRVRQIAMSGGPKNAPTMP